MMKLGIKEIKKLSGLLDEGVRKTAARLGKVTGAGWELYDSSLNEVPAVHLLSWFERKKASVVGTHFHSSSLLPLECLILFPARSARVLTEAFVKPFAERMKGMPNVTAVTIGEISNYLAHSMVGVLADKLDTMVILKPPEVVLGRKLDLLVTALEGYDGRKDTLLVSQLDLGSKALSVRCSVILVVNTEMVGKLLETIG